LGQSPAGAWQPPWDHGAEKDHEVKKAGRIEVVSQAKLVKDIGMTQQAARR
jgi:hypothetical protein